MRPISLNRRLLFLAATFIPIFALQETVSRLLFPLPEVPSFNRLHYSPLAGCIQHEEVRRRGLSNVVIRWQCEADGWQFDQHLNLYGFRGRNFAIEPPKGRPRVLFIGDSFVEGVGAADDQTIPVQFERLVADGRPVEAINLGVCGADFLEYVRLVRDSVPLLRPKAVFLVVYTNDLPAPPLPTDGGAKAPRFTPRKTYVPRLAQVMRRLARGETVPRFFPSGPYPFFEPVPSPANILTSRPTPDNLDPQLLDAMRRGTVNPYLAGLGEHTERAMRHDFSTGGVEEHLRFIQQICETHGAELTIAYIPILTATNPDYIRAQNRLGGPGYGALQRIDGPHHRRQQDHLRSVTAGLGIPFLDMTERLTQAEQSQGRMYWAIDTHCTPAGYRVVAEVCAGHWRYGGRQVIPAGSRTRPRAWGDVGWSPPFVLWRKPPCSPPTAGSFSLRPRPC